METGFENQTNVELCREWDTIMQYSTLESIQNSIRFMRICQELDNRKLTPFSIGHLLASTN